MFSVLKFFWTYMRTSRGKMIIGFILCLSATPLVIYRPSLFGGIIDNIIAIQANNSLIWKPITLILGLTVVHAIFVYGFRSLFDSFSQDVIFKIREGMYKKLSKLDFSYFDKNRTGDIMTKFTSDIDMIRHFFAYTMFAVIENIIIFISAIAFMMFINVPLTLILVAITPFVAWITYKYSKTIRPCFHGNREAYSHLNTVVQENISGNRVVKAFAQEDYEMEKFEEANERYKAANVKTSFVSAKYIPPIEFISSSLSFMLILVGGILAIWGKVTIGEIFTFNMLLWALNNPMRMSGWLISEVERFVASAERVREFLGTTPDIATQKHFIVPDRLEGRIEFKDVNFNYNEDPILQNINMKVEPGQIIALVGPTGSGKSTLINLICRFYDATKGEILIDDMDIKTIELHKLRQNISTAMQDIFLFSDTIEGNIAYGNPDVSFDEVKKVAKVADADSFIESMPEGYDTIVGERGVGLSGGQKQRIALARALLKNPSILILDDTTSSVDMETEHEIHKTLKDFFAGRTTFIIAHRISSVKHADKIFVLSDGQIIEEGTHDELIKRPAEEAYYRSVYENQYGDFDTFYNHSATVESK